MKRRAGLIYALPSPWVSRDDNRQPVAFGDRIEDVHQLGKIRVGIDVLFAMRAYDEKLIGAQAQPSKDIRRLDARSEILQHFEQRTSRLDDCLGRKAFAKQVLSGN